MLNSIKITDITKTKKGYNALFCENGFLFSVDDLVLAQEKIKIGSCFTSQELNLIYKKSGGEKALQKGYKLLSYRPHCKNALYRKLCDKFDPDCAQYACDKLEDLGLINDKEYTQLMTQYLINTKKYSVTNAKMKLLTLGINKDIIEECLSEYKDEDTQLENLIQLIEKKYRSKLSNPQKVVQSLMRKGFSYRLIKKALQEIEIELEDNDLW